MIETVKIKSDAHPSGYIIVNKDDAHKYKGNESKGETPRAARRKTKE